MPRLAEIAYRGAVRQTRIMRIHLYTVAWNEMAMLGFFFRHYDPWVERYVVYDDGSDDGTLDFLHRHPRVEVRRFQRIYPDSFTLSSLHLNNQVWKESRGAADWVIVNEIDEHFYHPDFGGYLTSAHRAGVTAIPALGFEMVSEEFPDPAEHLVRTRTRGVPDPEWYNKLCVFDPNAVEEMHYERGRHAARPVGRIVYPDTDELQLLHYRYLNLEHVLKRNRLLATGLGSLDRANGWCSHLDRTEAQMTTIFADLQAQAVDLSTLDKPGHSDVAPWWRQKGGSTRDAIAVESVRRDASLS
jgi:hypothetical protein